MIKSNTIVFLIVLLSSFYIVPAQEQTALKDSIVEEEQVAISFEDLSSQLELINQELKGIDNKTAISNEIVQIDSLLPINKKKLAAENEAYRTFKNSQPNKQKVLNLINKWEGNLVSLESWQATVNSPLNKNVIWLDQLDIENRKWSVTLQKATNQQAGIEVVKEIELTVLTINKLIKKIKEQNNYFLDLETKILVHKGRVNTVIEELEATKHSEQFSVFFQRHRPIWDLGDEESTSQKTLIDTWASLEEEFKSSIRYLKSPENKGGLFLFLVLVLGLIQWRYSHLFGQIKSKRNDRVLTKNIQNITPHLIASIVFNISILAILFFTYEPNLLKETFLLIGLIACIPIFKPAANPKFKGVVHYIILLYVLNTLKSYVWFSASIYRIFLFVESVLAILIVIKLVHPYLKTRRLDVLDYTKLFIRLAPVALVLFIVAIISNLSGFTNLTDLALNVGILGSTLIAILEGILVVFKSLAAKIIQFYYSKAEAYNFKKRLYFEKRINQAVNIFAILFVTYYFLDVLDLYFDLAKAAKDFLITPVKAGSLTFIWGNIFSFFGVLVISYILTSVIAVAIDGGAIDFLKLPKGVPSILSVVVRYFIIGFAVVVSLSYLNIDLSQFNLMAGALGLGIGFGLQNIISNFISGLILIFERPVQMNDVIELGPLMGTVKKVGVRSSHVYTFDGAEVVVPNSNLISNEVINWTLSDNIKRLEISIGTSYGSDLQQVANILSEVALSNKYVVKDPAPLALFDNFGDSSLEFRLLYWVPVKVAIISKSEISIAVYERFTKEGITIPFPQRDVNFRREDLDSLSNSNFQRLIKPDEEDPPSEKK